MKVVIATKANGSIMFVFEHTKLEIKRYLKGLGMHPIRGDNTESIWHDCHGNFVCELAVWEVAKI